jgi:hypothetical protein
MKVLATAPLTLLLLVVVLAQVGVAGLMVAARGRP